MLVTLVITLHLPGVLIDVGNSVTVSVEGALKCAAVGIPNNIIADRRRVHRRALRISAVIVFIIGKRLVFNDNRMRRCGINTGHNSNISFLIISYGIEDDTVGGIFGATEIYV